MFCRAANESPGKTVNIHVQILDRANMQKAAEVLEGFGIKMKAPTAHAPEYFFADDEEASEDTGDA